MPYDPSDLAEQAAWDKLHAINDEDFSGEILQEMSGAIDRPEFMRLLQAVREGIPLNIGIAFNDFAHALMLETVDGNELARQADEDARAEAADARRDQRNFLGR
jgi:hypothetical protein